jgi:hypothetical protein
LAASALLNRTAASNDRLLVFMTYAERSASSGLEANGRDDSAKVAPRPPGAPLGRLEETHPLQYTIHRSKSRRHQAYQLVSVAGNVAVTQLVDKPNFGIHVRMPKSVFTSK